MVMLPRLTGTIGWFLLKKEYTNFDPYLCAYIVEFINFTCGRVWCNVLSTADVGMLLIVEGCYVNKQFFRNLRSL